MAGFQGIYTKEERERKIRAEQARMKKVLKPFGGDQRKAMEKLVLDAAFMAVTLEEARQIITRDGIIETYQNGQNQSGQKKSSTVEVYDRMVNTYAKVVRQICDAIPEQPAADPAEELMRFVTGVAR